MVCMDTWVNMNTILPSLCVKAGFDISSYVYEVVYVGSIELIWAEVYSGIVHIYTFVPCAPRAHIFDMDISHRDISLRPMAHFRCASCPHHFRSLDK